VSLLADLIFGAKDPTPSHFEGDYDLTTRGDGAMWRLRAYQELGERDARRKARAARWRRSWLHRAGAWLGDILQRPAPIPQGRILMAWPRVWREPQEPPAERLSSVYEALTTAQLTAHRAGQRELADALHAVFLLNLTGNIADMAPLVASVRASLQSALGDDPGERVN
jgi:hypothetical protein